MAKGKYHEWITEEGLLKLQGLARDGYTDQMIADAIGINVSTLYNWKNDYLEIGEALKKGKDVIDRQVENALLKRAIGYQYVETRIEESDLGVRTTTTHKHIAPDTGAMIFWLKNRKPTEWRDKQNIEHSGTIDISERAKEIESILFGKES